MVTDETTRQYDDPRTIDLIRSLGIFKEGFSRAILGLILTEPNIPRQVTVQKIWLEDLRVKVFLEGPPLRQEEFTNTQSQQR